MPREAGDTLVFHSVGAHTKVQGPLSSGRTGKPAWEGLGNESGCLECGIE